MEQTNSKKPLLKRWWIWVLIVLGIFIIIGSIGGSDKTGPTSQNTPVAAPEPAFSLTAIKMASDYKENEVAADAKYKGKLVELSGTVDTIGKDISDTPYIAFETENQYEVINRVQCMFKDGDTQALSAVSKGQKITLRGTVSGSLGNIIVKDCQIVQ